MRYSSVVGLSYINSVECLKYLIEAVSDINTDIKLKALAGIADIANEYNSEEAINFLKLFKYDDNKLIKDFVSDELSLLE